MVGKSNRALDDLRPVDLVTNVKGQSNFFIDWASPSALFMTIGMMLVFLALHSFVPLREPSRFSTKDDYFPLNASKGNITVDVDLTLSALHDFHRFAALAGSFRTGAEPPKNSIQMDLTVKQTTLKDFAVVDTGAEEKMSIKVDFTDSGNYSSTFKIGRTDILGVDTVMIRLSLQGDFTNIVGIKFTWSFSNPRSEKYTRSARLLMSFLSSYMLIVFVFYLRFDVERWSQVFLLVLGVAGIFASNPIGIWIRGRTADAVALAVFIALWRFFLIAEFDMLRLRTFRPGKGISIVGVFLGVLSLVDAMANIQRSATMAAAEEAITDLFPAEYIMLCGEVVFVIVAGIWCGLAVKGNDGVAPRRVWFFAFVFILQGVTSILARVVCPLADWLMGSDVRQMLVGSVHVTLAAMSVFMLHSGSGQEYTPIQETVDLHAEDVVFGVDEEEVEEGED